MPKGRQGARRGLVRIRHFAFEDSDEVAPGLTDLVAVRIEEVETGAVGAPAGEVLQDDPAA